MLQHTFWPTMWCCHNTGPARASGIWPSTFWWLLTGGAVAIELLTGTLPAHAGHGAGRSRHCGPSGRQYRSANRGRCPGRRWCSAGWYFKQSRNSAEPRAEANPNVNLDIRGSHPDTSWNPDGTADVQYRGAHWTAIHRAGVSPSAGMHRVAEMVGNRLLVDKA